MNRPNVVLFLTDDQGPWALGRYTPEFHTPTIDRLADEGTSLERFFCASPVCSPARASLLTGRMPSGHGIHDWITPDGVDHPLPSPTFLEGRETIAQLLSRSGYICAMVGKWHAGYAHDPAPGYDYWYSHRYGGGPYYNAPIWAFDHCTGRSTVSAEPAEEPRYFTDAVGEQAVDFLTHHRDDQKPFFLHVATTAPHDPWTGGNHPQELLDLFADTDFPSIPQGEVHPWSLPGVFDDARANRHGALSGYAAAVAGVDRMVDRVLTQLTQLGLLENTIVIFTSDNGFSCGHHGIWGKGNGTSPLNFWEPSVRVPFIVRGPGIAVGRSCDALVSSTSVYETVAELTGSAPADDPLRHGRSVVDVLRSDGDDNPGGEEFVRVIDEYGGGRMVRTDTHKLVLRYDGPGELYQLDDDPLEQNNLFGVASAKGIQDELTGLLHRDFAACIDPALDGWQLPITGSGQRLPIPSTTSTHQVFRSR
ncbi:sulfatase-like hydrolase/transferase [Devriesea agamarum]|uniref:sulfatase-like hydrolase/transferase n=1 Tax=Devriesea agamarum TaxID=472569 RepID=UPI00071D8940|nr:sulfatase-like hydrolase/transferase [Devriesea agamarum]